MCTGICLSVVESLVDSDDHLLAVLNFMIREKQIKPQFHAEFFKLFYLYFLMCIKIKYNF